MVTNSTAGGLSTASTSCSRALVLAAGVLFCSLIVLASLVAIVTNIVSVSNSIVQVASIVEKTSLRPVQKTQSDKCFSNRELSSKKASQAGADQTKRNGCSIARSA